MPARAVLSARVFLGVVAAGAAEMKASEVEPFIDGPAQVVVCGNVGTPYVGFVKWWDEGTTVKLEPIAALGPSLPLGYRNGSGIILISDITEILAFLEL
jgi:hypothetical protein